MKNINALKRTAKLGLEYLRGAQDIKEAEVFLSANERFVGRLNYTSAIPCNGVQELKSDACSGVSVRIAVQTPDCLKIGVGSQDQETSLDGVKKALIKAKRTLIADPHFKSLPKPVRELPDLENYHDQEVMGGNEQLFVQLAWKVLNGALAAFEEAGFKKEDSLSITGDITILREQIAVANTNGIFDSDETTILMAFITAMIEGKDSKGTGWASATHFNQFDADGAGRMAAKSAIAGLNGKRIQSGRYNVVFGPQAIGTIFEGLVTPCLGLSAAVLNISPFKEKLDQVIMSEDISVYDDGSLAGQMASKRITCEGIPTGRTQLIDRGRLVGLLADTYFANRAGDARFVPRSGFRFGTGGRLHRITPGISHTNLVVESANAVSSSDLLEKVKNGIYIGRLWYLYPINGIGSGDFTGTVVGDSFLIKDGRIASPLKPNTVRINDNWLKLLKDNVLGVSQEGKSTLEWASQGTVIAPEIAFSGVELEEIDIFLE